MEGLNLPTYSFNIKLIEGLKYIFDEIRKKFVRLTPEEWVRQNFIKFLNEEKKYPKSLIGIEIQIDLNQTVKRCDIVVYNRNAEPVLIVECKASDVKLNQSAFDQVARYNMKLKVNYLIVTNGMKYYCCHIDYKNSSYSFLQDIPDYSLL